MQKKVHSTGSQSNESGFTKGDEHLRAIIDNSSDIITILDTEGTIRYKSPIVKTILGYNPPEIMGHNAFEFIHPQDKEEVHQIFLNLLKDPKSSASAEFRFRHKDGSYRILESKATNQVENQLIHGILVNSRDMTERKQIEVELKKKRQQLLESQLLAHMGNWQWDVINDRFQWSDEFLRANQLEQYQGQQPLKEVLDLLHPSDKEMAKKKFEEAIKQSNIFSMEIGIRNFDGSHRIFRMYGRPISDEGKVIRVEGTAQDITVSKEIENELRLSKEDLEKRVVERTRELSLVNEKLVSSLREKEVLINEIHHRVKNNLQIISSLINLQRNLKKPESSTTLQNRIKAMALVHEKLYRADDLSQVDFRDYMQNLAQYIFRAMAPNASNISLHLAVDQVYLDLSTATSLGLIANELVTNALEHGLLPQQGGNIHVRLKKDIRECTLEVCNDGIRPKEEDLKNPNSLGLVLVRSLVDQLDGSLKIDLAGDICFAVTFPHTMKSNDAKDSD